VVIELSLSWSYRSFAIPRYQKYNNSLDNKNHEVDYPITKSRRLLFMFKTTHNGRIMYKHIKINIKIFIKLNYFTIYYRYHRFMQKTKVYVKQWLHRQTHIHQTNTHPVMSSSSYPNRNHWRLKLNFRKFYYIKWFCDQIYIHNFQITYYQIELKTRWAQKKTKRKATNDDTTEGKVAAS
jgi:hypothetical protein